MASCTKDIFKEMEESIESTFNELIAILNTRRDDLLSQLKEIRSKYLQKERIRLEHLQDLEKMIEQLSDTKTKQKWSRGVQDTYVADANKKKEKFLQPTPVASQEFVFKSLDEMKGILAEYGEIVHAPYIDKENARVTFGRKGVKPGCLSVPLGLSHGNNSIFVVDMMNHRIQVFNMDGDYELKFGWQQLSKPHGIFVDFPKIFVTDSDQNAIYLFQIEDSNGLLLSCIGIDSLDTPLGISGDNHGCIYVADSNNNRVAVFDIANSVLSREIGNAKLNNPRDVTIHADNVYVIDYSVPFHVHQFELDGTEMRSIISLKGGTGTLFFCIDTSDNIIVSDGASSCMQMFNSKGLLSHSIDVKSPGGVAVTEEGDIVCVRKYEKEQIGIY